MNFKERGITVGDLLIIFLMDIKRKIDSSKTPNFFSKEMIITKKSLNENQLKYTYQKQLISDLDNKHKDCLLYTSPSPRDMTGSRMPASA